MLESSAITVNEFLCCAASIGIASLCVIDDSGRPLIGRCYPAVEIELHHALSGPLPDFREIWKQLRHSAGAGGGLDAFFLPDVLSGELDGVRYRMRYTPQARVQTLTGGVRIAREIDLRIF